MRSLLLLTLLLNGFAVLGQATSVFTIRELPQQGVLLDKNWKWQPGDNPQWAKPEFDVTADRIRMINQLHNIRTQAQIVDLVDSFGEPCGTKVSLDIPV